MKGRLTLVSLGDSDLSLAGKHIYLPHSTPAECAATTGAQPPGGLETVLVVEDRDDVRRATVSILESYGYRVLQAGGAKDALALMETSRTPVDLTIADLVMPGMNGCDLSVILRERYPAMRILLISGYPGQLAAGHPEAEWKENFLSKPFTPEALAAKVRAVLGRAGGETICVLVADDDDGVRKLICDVIREAGFEVVGVRNGIEILSELSRREFHLVITDIFMPERDGIEVIQAIRRQYPDTRVIAVSGAFGGAYLKHARLLGAHAAFAKPLDPALLVAAVRDLTCGRRAGEPPQSASQG